MFSMRTKMKPKVHKLIFQDVDWAYTFQLGFNWGWFVKKHSQFNMGKGTYPRAYHLILWRDFSILYKVSIL